jgi:Polyketide cyclase / dehydrase and lipid transport
MRRTLLLVTGLGAGVGALRLAASGKVTVDLGIGRSVRALGPVTWRIAAPPEVVFDVIADPYLQRTPRALKGKLDVWERGSDMALAAHFTQTRVGTTTTVETVRFDRPTRIDFRLLRGPVPHVSESFDLTPSADGTELTWQGELGTDLWAAGRWWGTKVAAVWEATVRQSLESITAEAERRAG